MTNIEVQRLKAVRQFDLFEFNLHKGLEDILELAADICQTPVAFITLIDEDMQLFKVCRGFQLDRSPRNATSFCNHAIMHNEVMVVPDAMQDERFVNNSFVTSPLNVRFYAGAPLATEDGHNIGTLCVYDAYAKELAEEKKNLLGILARQSIHLMELEMSLKTIRAKTAQIALQNDALMDIAFTQSHEFRRPLANIMGIMNLIKDDDYTAPREYLEHMDAAVTELDEKVKIVVKSTEIARQIVMA